MSVPWEDIRTYERERAMAISEIWPKIDGKSLRERMRVYGQELAVTGHAIIPIYGEFWMTLDSSPHMHHNLVYHNLLPPYQSD